MGKGDRGIQILKDKKLGKKVMFCVWWNYEGIVYFNLLEYGRTVNFELYKEQLTIKNSTKMNQIKIALKLFCVIQKGYLKYKDIKYQIKPF